MRFGPAWIIVSTMKDHMSWKRVLGGMLTFVCSIVRDEVTNPDLIYRMFCNVHIQSAWRHAVRLSCQAARYNFVLIIGWRRISHNENVIPASNSIFTFYTFNQQKPTYQNEFFFDFCCSPLAFSGFDALPALTHFRFHPLLSINDLVATLHFFM